jgi:phosphoenolpyruvate phosphomutase
MTTPGSPSLDPNQPERPRPRVIVGTHNALSARLVEEAGFDGCWVSSLEVCACRGIPDRNLIGSREMIEVAQQIRNATALPVFVDCDNGYGTDLAAARAARELSSCGVTGACIEDNAFPKRNSLLHDIDRELECVDSFCGRIQAMRDAAGDEFMIIARTEGLIARQRLEDVVYRAEQYAKAGADMIVIHDNQNDPARYLGIARAWTHAAPLVAIPTACPDLTLSDLQNAGYSMVIYANHLLRAATRQMRLAAAQLRASGCPSDLANDISGVNDLLRLSGEWGWPAADQNVG